MRCVKEFEMGRGAGAGGFSFVPFKKKELSFVIDRKNGSNQADARGRTVQTLILLLGCLLLHGSVVTTLLTVRSDIDSKTIRSISYPPCWTFRTHNKTRSLRSHVLYVVVHRQMWTSMRKRRAQKNINFLKK